MIWKIILFLLVTLNGFSAIRSDDPSMSSLGIIIVLVSTPLLFLEIVKFLKSSR